MSKTSAIVRGVREATAQSTSRTGQSKSRTEKSRAVAVAPLPPVAVEIVAGRFTEDDWASLVAQEDGEEVVGDIVESLLALVMEKCFNIYLTRQIIPYTIGQAQDAILQITEWAFVPRDEGETILEKTWQNMKEPLPCTTDSWAQGCVPIIQAAPSPCPGDTQVALFESISETPEQRSDHAPSQLDTDCISGPSNSTAHHDQPNETSNEMKNMASTAKEPPLLLQPVPPAHEPKRKKTYRPYRGPLRSAGLRNITKSLEDTEKEMLMEQLFKMREEDENDRNFQLLPTSLHNILKIQLGRPPQKKGVIYDDTGNVLCVPKLDPSRLPRHSICPQVELMDHTKETEHREKRRRHVGRPVVTRLPKADMRLREKETPRLDQTYSVGITPTTTDSPQLMQDRETCHPYTTSSSALTQDSKSPFPLSAGLLLNTMRLSHGVTLREGNSTERGSLYSLQLGDPIEKRRELKPIQASVTLPRIPVEQLIKNHTPHVRPPPTFISY
ncbi:uncharacterized protein LOC108704854 [Xenopus laevis]|uniref:Uncharacterized protein LOC108704854 n=1 Tax=Xenopus laevis TaxID=8355 RepID=A0A8J0U4X8_XENLA|nr:uncharacterized protein LOC108704854 [Xenopus laevis]XP_018097043.1 uncharacterized protein LOC108704854 [Xenopus laevis]XP_018097044.1 uncharacterized protein LOC108704854 [Xenopus laevis]OCT57307.1 hypothetical protein XELAEV_18003684mg [Xenopus laevis]